eukprot:scaffold184_cov316-Pinguiococcus_pyrenoidosus.AAC.16
MESASFSFSSLRSLPSSSSSSLSSHGHHLPSRIKRPLLPFATWTALQLRFSSSPPLANGFLLIYAGEEASPREGSRCRRGRLDSFPAKSTWRETAMSDRKLGGRILPLLHIPRSTF